MGGGFFDSNAYHTATSTRRATGTDDFAYSRSSGNTIHDTLKPSRIVDKIFKVLESRDSEEHPNSTAVIISFDVTGSNLQRAVDAQKTLPGLMSLVTKYIPDPQISIVANDDYYSNSDTCLQISEFESDNRIDDHIRNIKLVGAGGGNNGESYDLVLYAATYKIEADCWQKRQKKGYLFLYADEPFFDKVSKTQVHHVFGDVIDKDIPIKRMIELAKEKWEIFILWPIGGYPDAKEQYIELFGEESVITLQHPNKMSEVIGITIGLNEGKTSSTSAVEDLVTVGIDSATAANLVGSLGSIKGKKIAKTSGATLEVGGTGAKRL